MNFKKIALAAAAAAAATPAMAADLPVVAEPVNYVQACDAYGAGYFQLPGQDTCIRVHGRIRTQWVSHNLTKKLGVTDKATDAEYNAGAAVAASGNSLISADIAVADSVSAADVKAWNTAVAEAKADLADGDASNDAAAATKLADANALLAAAVETKAAVAEKRNDYSALARGYLFLESMTQTELMSIKTYTELTASWNESSSSTVGMGSAYLQLGFDNVSVLIGRSGSIYDAFGGYSAIGTIGVAEGGEDALQVSATASMGNGFTASFGVMDAEASATGTGVKNRVNFESALALTQGMFSANLSGAAHAYSDNDYGFAVAGTVEASVLENVKVGFGASYANNALSYIGGAQASKFTDGGADDAKGYTFAGGLEVGLSDKVTAALDASWTKLEQGKADYNYTVVNGSLNYAPVSGMAVVLDGGWSKDSEDNKNAQVTARVQYSF
ncbi:porin [Pseudovibrio sp. JE062]|uniref:porin n=1 Tax=Pseudovibrio sp. JE062 TaxID=439495 RepID=UPI000186C6F1|nr:porin [Pseudovibrio sp. JE062]EEA96352.1 porin Omp2a [Pseudovibrio sp. JE062]